jgi:hypothetical protein
MRWALSAHVGGVILWALAGIGGWHSRPRSGGDGLVRVRLLCTALNTIGVGLGLLHTSWVLLCNGLGSLTLFLYSEYFQLNSNDQISKIQNMNFLMSINFQMWNYCRSIQVEQVFFLAQLPILSGF